MGHPLIPLTSNEIPLMIVKASVFGGKIAQPSSTKNPTTLITRLDVDQCGVLFIKLQQEVPLEKKRPVSIKLNYRNLSFNLASDEYSIEGQTLIGHIPTSAKAIALRDTERYVFPLDTKIWGLMHRVENRGGHLDVRMVLVDVSKNGLGFIIPDSNKSDILPNDHVWVTSINGINLQRPVFGTVVYAYERKFKDTIDLKCGISLDCALPQEVLMELQQKCRLVLRG